MLAHLVQIAGIGTRQAEKMGFVVGSADDSANRLTGKAHPELHQSGTGIGFVFWFPRPGDVHHPSDKDDAAKNQTGKNIKPHTTPPTTGSCTP